MMMLVSMATIRSVAVEVIYAGVAAVVVLALLAVIGLALALWIEPPPKRRPPPRRRRSEQEDRDADAALDFPPNGGKLE